MQVPLEGDWSLEQNLQGGHSDIVRACRLDLSKGSAVSCGEDGQVCLWSAAQSSVASNSGLVNEKSGNNSLKVREVWLQPKRGREPEHPLRSFNSDILRSAYQICSVYSVLMEGKISIK